MDLAQKILMLISEAEKLGFKADYSDSNSLYSYGEAILNLLLAGGKTAQEIHDSLSALEFQRNIAGSDIAFYVMRAAINRTGIAQT